MKIASMAVCGLALAAAALSSGAQEKRPGYGPSVNAAIAKKIAAGAFAECHKIGVNIAIAVVDPHGFLVYFERMEDTQYAGMDIAVGKARSAAMYRRPTRAFFDAINKNPAIAQLPGTFGTPGGVPLMVDGKVTGGVGASGGTGDQDEQCVLAGIKSL